MSRLLVVAGAAIAAGAIAAPAASVLSAQQLPVKVYLRNDSHGVGVGTAYGNQPLVGAYTYDGRVCAGMSYQVPFCINTVQP